MKNPPASPKIYHIVHVDKLPSIVADGYLFSDAKMNNRSETGTVVGMNHIKQRRLTELKLACYPDLFVGGCVPFYFCSRSVMLYMLYKGNSPDLPYRDGQKPVVHLEADLYKTVEWAEVNKKRWAFTLSNAGSKFFKVRNNINNLDEINWTAVEARDWKSHKEGKQAEFLIEDSFPLNLVERIGVYSDEIARQALTAFGSSAHKPRVETLREWYY